MEYMKFLSELYEVWKANVNSNIILNFPNIICNI